MDIQEKRHQLRIERLTDQLEKACATHEVEEHNQHMHQQEEDENNVLEMKDFQQFKRFWEFHLGEEDNAQSEVSTNDFSTNDVDDSLSDIGIIRKEGEEEELDEPHNQMEESKEDDEKFS